MFTGNCKPWRTPLALAVRYPLHSPRPRSSSRCLKNDAVGRLRRSPHADAQGRLYLCGHRPGELFALRVDDIEPKLLRIDEALKETEKGDDRVGETKTSSSNAYVSISDELYKEITLWLNIRNMGDPYHRSRTLPPNDLLFPTEVGTPYRIGNYLKRILKPIAANAGIPDMTYRALRRTFATEFQRHGSPKDAQAQLRHSNLEMTGWYMREIPESVRSAVAEMDAEICQAVEANALPDARRPQ